ncbi:unnamed protein product [Penicillium roqueforti FM164]|uniref:Genomic scaffold, ProqFM164S02 n=1 Tax=Penicillium roqueforti (strain FM164) TaxID=1365484 RepID=W6Q2E3_PENRF|nr:unnamed protein product [Penicillium roqueforti FM164]
MPSRGPTIRSQAHSTPRDRRHDHGRHYELHLQICKPQGGVIHWMLVTRHPHSQSCTRLHSTGYMGNRNLEIEYNKRFDSWSVESTHLLGEIHRDNIHTVEAEAREVPLQSCQLWACYLMLRLERRGLLAEGTFDHYMNCYEHKREENYGPGHDHHHHVCPVHGR